MGCGVFVSAASASLVSTLLLPYARDLLLRSTVEFNSHSSVEGGMAITRFRSPHILSVLRVFLLVFSVSFARGTATSEEVHFVLLETGTGIVKLRSDGKCSPGTLIAFHPSRGADTINLRVVRGLDDSQYLAAGRTPKDKVELLKVGDTGTAATPLHNYENLKLAVSPSAGNALLKELQTRLRNEPIRWVDEAREAAEERIEISGQGGGEKWVLTSEFASPRTFPLRGIAMLPESVTGQIRDDASNHYWLSLTNNFWGQTGRGSSWIDVETTSTLTSDGKLPLNARVALRVTTHIGGYICLMVVKQNGEVSVLYPYQNNVDGQTKALEPFYVNGELNLALTASPPGPTHVVLLVSNARRPLSAFLDTRHHSVYLDINGERVAAETIGPGLFRASHADVQGSLTVEDLDPESWDIAKQSFEVASN
jgi:hypothetical protein